MQIYANEMMDKFIECGGGGGQKTQSIFNSGSFVAFPFALKSRGAAGGRGGA